MRATSAARPWGLLAAAFAGAVACTALATVSLPGLDRALDWQRGLLWSQPWRLWTAAFVHLHPLHVVASLLGCAVLGFVGGAAGVPGRAALAWALAWPLTHLALRVSPDLQGYSGLSGVLHAGAAVLAVELVATRRGRDRRIGTALVAGLSLKLLLERSWAIPVSVDNAWPFPVVTLAHLTGAVAGAACAAATIWWTRRPAGDAATLPGRSTLPERRQP